MKKDESIQKRVTCYTQEKDGALQWGLDLKLCLAKKDIKFWLDYRF